MKPGRPTRQQLKRMRAAVKRTFSRFVASRNKSKTIQEKALTAHLRALKRLDAAKL